MTRQLLHAQKARCKPAVNLTHCASNRAGMVICCVLTSVAAAQHLTCTDTAKRYNRRLCKNPFADH